MDAGLSDILNYQTVPTLSRPKPSDFSGEKILSVPFFGREVKAVRHMSQICGM
jgi:hypothetical protein